MSVILQMTDQSVIGNSLRVEDNIIYRGYRYGENSDVVLPFRNSYIQFIVEVFYHNCEKSVSMTVRRADDFILILSHICSMNWKVGWKIMAI